MRHSSASAPSCIYRHLATPLTKSWTNMDLLPGDRSVCHGYRAAGQSYIRRQGRLAPEGVEATIWI